MKLQNSYNISTSDPPSRRGRRAEKGLSFGVAFLGAVCVVGVFGFLALLFHAG